MGNVNTISNNTFCKKIRFFPSKQLKILLNQFFGTSRYIYNKAVEYLNDQYITQKNKYIKDIQHGCVYLINNKQCCNPIHKKSKFFCKKHINKKLQWNLDLNFVKLRNKLVKRNGDIKDTDDDKWLKNVPFDTRQLILKNVIGSYKSAITNKKNGNIKHFDIKYMSLKNPTQFCHLEKRSVNIKKCVMFSRRKDENGNKYTFRLKKKMRNWCNKYINKLKSNIIIKKEKLNGYYMCIPMKMKNINNKHQKDIHQRHPETSKYNSVFLDPGVRTFQTFYSSDGICGKLGHNIINKIVKCNKKIDKLKSLYGKVKKRTRYNMKKRCLKLRTKIKNIISDLHWRTASWLCKNFQNIFIPSFETSQMAKKGKRKIGKKVVRNMLTLSHYKFQEKLRQTARWYQNRNVYIISEHYTSKTCGMCGKIDRNLKGSKVYKCTCGYKQDRDINAARNMLIKLLS